MTLNTGGGMKSDINVRYSGYEALYLRETIKEKKQDKVVQSLLKEVKLDGKIEKKVIEYPDSMAMPHLDMRFEINSKDYMTQSDNKYFIQPLLGFAKKNNPFVGDKRIYDIDLGIEKKKIV